MAYFIILPIYVFVSLVLILAALVSPRIELLKIYLPYRWAILIWSSVGFWLLNTLGWGLPVAILASVDVKFDSGPPTAKNFFMIVIGIWILIGPFVLSPIGFVLGSLWGWWRTRKKLKTKV